MPRYVKKPIIIEARQFSGYPLEDDSVYKWIAENKGTARALNRFEMEIVTLEGAMKAEAGDWIIRGIKGEFYPCKDDIFRQTYDSM